MHIEKDKVGAIYSFQSGCLFPFLHIELIIGDQKASARQQNCALCHLIGAEVNVAIIISEQQEILTVWEKAALTLIYYGHSNEG